jgi:serine/threonine protein phosphatase PrpC
MAPVETVHENLLALFDAFDAKLLSDFTENFKLSMKIPIQAIRQNHVATKLRDQNIRNAVERAKSGSTALVAYVEGNILHLANTGDCRAGIC